MEKDKEQMIEKMSIAPMVDRTTYNFRQFIRMLNKKSTLYTEMITAQAIINGDSDRLLRVCENEHKIVLQLAASSLEYAKAASKIIKNYPYDEININAGCPSNRVSDNKMGAYLMSDVDTLCDIVKGVQDICKKPVTVKHRIGIDGTGILPNDKKIVTYEELLEFVDRLHEIGVSKNIIHARIAILKGLSPSENRSIPPIDYEMVYRLKKDRPKYNIEINGGIKTLDDVKKHLSIVDSVMIGRRAYDDPMLFNEGYEREQILEKMILYLENEKGRIYHFTMHTLGLFYGTKYSKIWKNIASNSKVEINDIKEFLNKLKLQK